MKLKSTNEFKGLIEEFKLNKRPLEGLDNELFENLIEKEKEASVLLKLSLFLDPDLSPFSIYTDLFKIDEDDFYEALDVLIKLSLITKEEDDEGMEYGIRIHRTLQNEFKQFLELKYENEFEILLTNQLERIENILNNNRETNQWNKLKYYNNFKRIVDKNLNNKSLNEIKKLSICNVFGKYSINTNLGIKNSLIYYSKSLEINRKIFGTDDNLLSSENFNNIGEVYEKLGIFV